MIIFFPPGTFGTKFFNTPEKKDKLVKQINAQYPGFEAIFKNAFQSIKSPDEINNYVAGIKDGEGNQIPSQVSSWLKEILKKRIF